MFAARRCHAVNAAIEKTDVNCSCVCAFRYQERRQVQGTGTESLEVSQKEHMEAVTKAQIQHCVPQA